MNQQPAPILGVIARGGVGPTGDASVVTVTDPASPTWANDLFRSHGGSTNAIIFVPELERNPRIGRGTQLDELLPEQSPQVAVVNLPTHVTGIQAAIRDCAPLLGQRAEFIAAVRAHVAGSYAGVWLRSVARLESPSPSFGQHLRSWVPFSRGQFVTLHPTVSVRRRPEALPATGDAPPGTARLLRASSAPNNRCATTLSTAYATHPPEVLGTSHRMAARWGSERAVEYVVTPEAAPLRLPPPDGRCPNCGDPIWGRCAFCHLTPPRLEHWMSVAVPGVAPVDRAFQLPRPTPKPDVAAAAPGPRSRNPQPAPRPQRPRRP
ncbi:MAG TPA: hypothetical protein VG502_08755 [Flexivirga sp.]|uniref:hypothetical protein n=1 Tax=Flexivirga sp. TaxID=1962927 RepID=UPI002BD51142|nr:hypothetical protein [Flexivirga sp.]HWC22372.1 hypothetical protein [Flexivirga sp.]